HGHVRGPDVVQPQRLPDPRQVLEGADLADLGPVEVHAPPAALAECREVELLDVAEVVVDEGLVAPGRPGDGAGGRPAETFGSDDVDGGRDNALLRLRRLVRSYGIPH